jgi:hypothetical protein
VPVSVTALTAGVLERGNVRELGDLVREWTGKATVLATNDSQKDGSFTVSGLP